MKMINNEIYSNAIALQKAFAETVTLPVKVNFYLQKNKATLSELAREIEESRVGILQKYGTLNDETNQFEFSKEDGQTVIKELNELLDLEQDVKIYTVKIEDFGDNLTLTTEQMEALMFMID